MAVLVNLVYKSNKSGYPQVILEDCKYMVRNETTKRFIAENLFDFDFNSNSDYVS